MTEIQFNEIKERLTQWRQERHLTYENQQAGFLGNVFEEVSEYFRAKNDLERADALCDIAVFLFNSIDLDYESYHYSKLYTLEYSFLNIYHRLGNIACNKIYNGTLNVETSSELISILDVHFRKELKLDFYKCMLETIKEIESRVGEYKENLKKFIKDDGAYTESEACELARKEFIEYCMKNHKPFDVSQVFSIKYDIIKGCWLIEIYNSRDKNSNEYCLTGSIIKKWYKADYESCRL